MVRVFIIISKGMAEHIHTHYNTLPSLYHTVRPGLFLLARVWQNTHSHYSTLPDLYHTVRPGLFLLERVWLNTQLYTDMHVHTAHRKQYKIFLVKFPNTVVNPGTVMVHPSNTMFTCATRDKNTSTLLPIEYSQHQTCDKKWWVMLH